MLHRPWDSKVEEKGDVLQQGDHKRQREVKKAQSRDQQPSWGSKRSPDWDGLVDTVFKEEVGLEGRQCTVGKTLVSIPGRSQGLLYRHRCNSMTDSHLCFKQAQPKMYHSPKVDDGVDIFFF